MGSKLSKSKPKVKDLQPLPHLVPDLWTIVGEYAAFGEYMYIHPAHDLECERSVVRIPERLVVKFDDQEWFSTRDTRVGSEIINGKTHHWSPWIAPMDRAHDMLHKFGIMKDGKFQGEWRAVRVE